MENQKKNRAIIFIDGNNFYYKLKDIVSKKEEVYSLLEFDYRAFAKALIKEDALTEIRYYVGAVKRTNGKNREKSEQLYAGQQKLLAKLHQQEIPVVLGNLIQHPDRSFHEKGVDVRVAVEMIRLAREDKYDIAYLKLVIYVGVSKGQSFGLTKASNNTILLRDEDVLPYFPKTLLDSVKK